LFIATKRVPELQILRGLAAAIVALAHVAQIYTMPHRFKLALDTALNAHAAVIFFFVLSGYVLSLSLMRSGINREEIINFYFRRACRIFPAMWASCVISIAVACAINGYSKHPLLSGIYLPAVWPAFFAWNQVLNPPTWSVLAEMTGSFFLPLFVWIALRKPKFVLPLIILLLIFTLQFSNHQHLSNFGFLLYFALGMIALIAPPRFSRAVAMHPKTVALISLIAFLLFRYFWFRMTTGHWQTGFDSYSAPIPAIIEGISTVLLIMVINRLSGRLPWLVGGWLGTLGNISYSFYLLHYPAIIFLAGILSPFMTTLHISGVTATAILAISTFGLTVPLALLMYRFLERPGISLGRILSKRRTIPRPVLQQ
jgi:peptidoglycan/LPS O-acetylase OafA/YrhL